MAKRRRRRVWEDEEKRRIVAQTQVPGVSVSQVARRYDVNANLVFKWLRDPRFRPADEDMAQFLPVEVLSQPVAPIVKPAQFINKNQCYEIRSRWTLTLLPVGQPLGQQLTGMMQSGTLIFGKVNECGTCCVNPRKWRVQRSQQLLTRQRC